jgi:ParB family chromosome partitioning protein
MITPPGDIDSHILSEGTRMTQTTKYGGACWRMLLALVALALLVSAVAPQGAWATPRSGVTPDVRQAPDYPALNDPSPDVRAAAVQAIRKTKDVDAVPALVAHIEDPDERVGLYIAQALAELAPPDVVPLLLTPLLRFDANGRWRSAYVLGERKEMRAVSVLARALTDDEVLVASTAAGALAKIGTPAAIAALIGSLTSERPAEVHTAMNGLLALGDAAVPALAEALEAADGHVEFHASQVLQAIGTPAAMAALNGTVAQ